MGAGEKESSRRTGLGGGVRRWSTSLVVRKLLHWKAEHGRDGQHRVSRKVGVPSFGAMQ
jgi:hypothetical protein